MFSRWFFLVSLATAGCSGFGLGGEHGRAVQAQSSEGGGDGLNAGSLLGGFRGKNPSREDDGEPTAGDLLFASHAKADGTSAGHDDGAAMLLHPRQGGGSSERNDGSSEGGGGFPQEDDESADLDPGDPESDELPSTDDGSDPMCVEVGECSSELHCCDGLKCVIWIDGQGASQPGWRPDCQPADCQESGSIGSCPADGRADNCCSGRCGRGIPDFNGVQEFACTRVRVIR